ncbi:MAG TPA: cytochrome P450 [Acidimicrobiales bacterium]|nr:cytochrome P450 [Acidimicrobiales bacterium]
MGDQVTEQEVVADAARMYATMYAWEEVPERAEARRSAEPQPMYVELAERCPVVHNANGSVTLLRMDDILFVNKNRAVVQASKFLGSNRPAIPLGLDGPEHTKYRRLLDPVFTAKRVAPLADQVRDLANRMIDGFVDGHEVDAYVEWCEPLPSQIFLSIMGLPTEDLPAFLEFKELTLSNEQVDRPSAEEQEAKRAQAVEWIQSYFNRALDEREERGDPGDDMLGWLLTTEVGGQRLTRENLHDILGLLMIAGLDTVAASLACFLSYFARHPERRAELLADPSRWPSAVEELMRFESPVTDGGRIALEDLELPSGERIPAGTVMGVSWSAANLDPTYFPDPLAVDFDRSPNPHIGFASGFHRCLGSHLARMEMVTAMEVWHRRIPNYRIAPGAELVYSGNPRAPHHLPLVWD